MPTSLTATKIKDTYGQVLHVDGGVTSTPKLVYDGDGTATALKVSTTDVQVNNSPVLTDADIGSSVQAYDADLTAWSGKTAPTGTVVGTSDSQTLTNKTISGSSNTLSNIGNAALTNSKVTIGSTNVSLGATATTLAGLTSVTATTFTGALTGGVTGNVSGNAGTVTNGVYTVGDQTIGGTKTFSANPILNAGTANGVAYLNGSKVLTTGSALTFDGTNLSVSGSNVLRAVDIGSTVQAYDADIPTVAASQGEMEAGTAAALRSMSPLRIKQAISALAVSTIQGLFRKADPTIVAFTKTGAGSATTSTTIYVEVNGVIKTVASGTSITMPTFASGTDYAIWCKPDGTLEATSNHTSPPVANSRKIGGFHYAPGGNATGTSGGNTTPQINEYSFWDLKFRPSCSDPRGMTLVGGGYWMDIYLTGVDAITNGSSKYNVTMADGASPPKIPTMFGGNGSTTYGSYTWFEAMELATSFGKRCPTQQEFMSAMYGTTEASSVGSDQGSTVLNAAYTSKWGVIQSTGVLWIWARDRGGAYNTGGWNANTEGRGSEYNAPNAARLGGNWDSTSDSGSRCSSWNDAASLSYGAVGSRFCCDHLQLD